MSTERLSKEVWKIDPQDYPADAPAEARAKFLLQYAILAPSSHNSQPWTFDVDASQIELRFDRSRWLEVADPDRRELHLSMGCALENLILAAQHFGWTPAVDYIPNEDPLAVVNLSADAPSFERPPELFDAITKRSTSHGDFKNRPVPPAIIKEIRDAALEDEVELLLIEQPQIKDSIAQLQTEADQRQMGNPDYRKELGAWLGAGVMGDRWPKARISQLVVRLLDLGSREGAKNEEYIRNAPLIALLSTPTDDATSRIRAGQIFERIALTATVKGLASHPLSQILEVPALKKELKQVIDRDGSVPQHLFRLGYATSEGEHTPRWPIERFMDT